MKINLKIKTIIDYLCIYIHNEHRELSLNAIKNDYSFLLLIYVKKDFQLRPISKQRNTLNATHGIHISLSEILPQ